MRLMSILVTTQTLYYNFMFSTCKCILRRFQYAVQYKLSLLCFLTCEIFLMKIIFHKKISNIQYIVLLRKFGRYLPLIYLVLIINKISFKKCYFEFGNQSSSTCWHLTKQKKIELSCVSLVGLCQVMEDARLTMMIKNALQNLNKSLNIHTKIVFKGCKYCIV